MAENLRTPTGVAGATNDQHQECRLTSVTPNIPAKSGATWTPALVEERLRKAVALKTALNSERLVADIIAVRSAENRGIIGGIGGMGSAVLRGGGDGLAAQAAEALTWLRWLETDNAALVRTRLSGAPWKSICWRFAISRPTADRRWRYALALIAWRLNGNLERPPPSLRSLLRLEY